jgi:biopolymer transport protein ExbD
VLLSQIRNEKAASIVLRSDKTVPVQDIVTVIDAVNEINRKNNTKHKVILATRPYR